jgi:hypothetical protein
MLSFHHHHARQATFDFGNKYRQMESSDIVKNFQGPQQVVTWIIKGDHPVSSGSSGSYFGRHFGRHVLRAVVTLFITQIRHVISWGH